MQALWWLGHDIRHAIVGIVPDNLAQNLSEITGNRTFDALQLSKRKENESISLVPIGKIYTTGIGSAPVCVPGDHVFVSVCSVVTGVGYPTGHALAGTLGHGAFLAADCVP